MITCSSTRCKFCVACICKNEEVDLVMTYSDAKNYVSMLRCMSFDPVGISWRLEDLRSGL